MSTSRSVVILLAPRSTRALRRSPVDRQMVQYIYGMWMAFSRRRSRGTGRHRNWNYLNYTYTHTYTHWHTPICTVLFLFLVPVLLATLKRKVLVPFRSFTARPSMQWAGVPTAIRSHPWGRAKDASSIRTRSPKSGWRNNYHISIYACPSDRSYVKQAHSFGCLLWNHRVSKSAVCPPYNMYLDVIYYVVYTIYMYTESVYWADFRFNVTKFFTTYFVWNSFKVNSSWLPNMIIIIIIIVTCIMCT